MCFHSKTYGMPNDASNPLSDKSRAVGPNDHIPSQFVGSGMMQRVLGAPTFTDFGGSGDQSAQNQMGALEGGPHGAVHVWTTDPKLDWNNPKPDMGVLASAAFDPVFFAHHANIDRIWDKWIKAPQSNHANPNNQAWLGQGFFFYDQAKNWTYITNNQMLEPELLSYRYQPPQQQQQPTPPVVAAAPPARARKCVSRNCRSSARRSSTSARAEPPKRSRLTLRACARRCRRRAGNA